METTEEVQLLVSPPERATGHRMSERVQSFEELTGQIHLTQLCEKKLSANILLHAGKRAKFNQTRTTDGEQLLLCREYSSSRFYPRAQASATVLEGTILDDYGIEVAIPSIANSTYTSFVVQRSRALCE